MRDTKQDHETKTQYECFDCGTVHRARTQPEDCPDCGGAMRNRQTPME